MDDVQISVVSGNGLTPAARAEILTFCCRAYGEDLAALFETFTGTTHVIGRYCRELASHACWVTRWLQPEGMAALRTAYVELVATAPEFRCRGYASRVMGRLAQEIADFDIGGLSPSRSSFYERLGWELWQGPLFIRRGPNREPSPADERVMIFRLPTTPPLDPRMPLSVEWREGEVW